MLPNSKEGPGEKPASRRWLWLIVAAMALVEGSSWVAALWHRPKPPVQPNTVSQSPKTP